MVLKYLLRLPLIYVFLFFNIMLKNKINENNWIGGHFCNLTFEIFHMLKCNHFFFRNRKSKRTLHMGDTE